MTAALFRRSRSVLPVAVVCALTLAPAHAPQASEWALCAPPVMPPAPDPELEAATLEADSAFVREDGISIVEGNVVLRTPERIVTAGRMEYDADHARAEASGGGITLRERHAFLEGERLEVDLESGEAVLEKARFIDSASHTRVEAERIEHDPWTTTFADGSYTRCDPGSNGWKLRAKSLEIDRDDGIGTARHARLEIAGLPVLYTPWISFPVGSARKTGYLVPSFGRSDSAGTSMTLPYYFNLAPNYDATLRSRLTSRRGSVLGGQFRYLTERSSGRIEAEALPEDRITGEFRSLASFRHRHRLTPRLGARVDYSRASDVDYLRDLRTHPDTAKTTYLRQFAEIAYETPALRFETQVTGFQLLRARPLYQDPYRVVPRLAVETRLPERNRRLNFHFRAEAARFDHPADLVATGTRLELSPSAELPMRAPFGHLIPKATLHYTGYDIDNSAGGVDDSVSRLLPSFSVDGGLFFDHQTTAGGRRLTHTLEPRLFYLRAAHRDQDRLPLFETGSLTSGYDHMFRENRFSGTDRIGDADRLTLALDSRLLDGGREVLGVRIGRMRHFRDRQVRLCTTVDPDPGSTYRCVEDATAADRWGSTWIAALKARPYRSITITGVVESDGGDSRHRSIALGFRYHPSPERLLNLDYRKFPIETTSVRQVQESWTS